MVWWDGEFKRKMGNVGLRLWLYKRYVDDTDSIMSVPKAGLRFDGNDLVEDELVAEIDQRWEPDEREQCVYFSPLQTASTRLFQWRLIIHLAMRTVNSPF